MSLVETQEELWGIDGSIVFYGIMANIFMIVPLVLYLTLADTNSWAPYHQTYINMLFSAYAPLGISWWIVLADDSKAARSALTGAIEMAGLGPFALLWVGYATFLMSAKANLTATNTMLWVWGLIYPICNIALIVMHYHLSPPMYAWLAMAPMLPSSIDYIKPWSLPVPKGPIPVTAGDSGVVFEEAVDGTLGEDEDDEEEAEAEAEVEEDVEEDEDFGEDDEPVVI